MIMTNETLATRCIGTQASLNYEVADTTDFLLQIAVRSSLQQSIDSEQFALFHNDQRVDDSQWSAAVILATGNRCHRFQAEPGNWRIEYEATVSKRPSREFSPKERSNRDLAPLTQLPADVLPYLNPSRYCESDRLIQQAENQFGQLPRDASLVSALEEAVFARTDYVMGSSNAQTTATDTYLGAAGVCRDFAHLLIALCRALRIPARYAAGYLVDLQPPDFHAVVEAYVGGCWQMFDATRLAPLDGFITIAVGRDAADVAFASYNGNTSMYGCTVSAVGCDNDASPTQNINHHDFPS